MKIIFNETTDLHLKHPVTDELLYDAKEKPMLAVIVGKQTSTFKNANDKALRSIQKSKQKNLSASEAEQKATELLSSCVVEFKNLYIEYEDGKFLDPKDVRGVLTNANWIKDQIDRAVNDLENFIQPV